MNWRKTNLRTVRFRPGGCYLVEFEYRVIAQGEFYCLLRSFGRTERGFVRELTRLIHEAAPGLRTVAPGLHGRVHRFLQISPKLVSALDGYSKNPADLLRAREQLLDLLEEVSSVPSARVAH